ncbi:hypothetical protein KILIM_083_00190 [Kineosphaera limosa NBRC 100340]|uniref:DNA-binding protein n=2 Tax=Kineosphaera TaxID=211469 RepID=K6VNQ1_9MICO|nr:OB-fold nucleic acid binding domain-containing protein [Kineosphaera limosa]GAB97823.1 hypothetical protein KILIM_083_00190 [Kineosphaera limosa NBRC 100340]
MGFWSRVRSRLTSSAAELEAQELSQDALEAGADPLGSVSDRALVDAVGVLRNISIPPPGQVPSVIGELFDGTGSLSIVWLGRREIPGIGCGVRLRVRGRVAMRRGQPVIYNPRYDILPAPGNH